MYKSILVFLWICIIMLLPMHSNANDNIITPEQSKVTNEIFLENNSLAKLNALTLEEKVAQLFIIVPEYLVDGYSSVTAAGEVTKNAFNMRPVGGIIYMGHNIVTPEQTRDMLKNMNNISKSRIGLPAFLCVDEEGGLVARVANNSNFNVKRFANMSLIGAKENTEDAYNVGLTIGNYLLDLGFNVDFAPVADVFTNPENTVIRQRAFGSNPEIVRLMSASVSRGLRQAGILTSYKHFPGHGNTAADTHNGYAFTNKTKAELMACELIPFVDAIKNQEPFIMVGHISLPNVIGDGTPASLSKVIINDLLRNELGYQGLIITDALNMGAICNQYSSEQACIKAIQAGVDVLLMPANFDEAYNGIIKAVKSGAISEERINESVLRIINAKMKLNRMIN